VTGIRLPAALPTRTGAAELTAPAALDHRGKITLDSVRVLMMHFLNICLISGSQRLSTARLLNCVRASPLNVKNVEVTL